MPKSVRSCKNCKRYNTKINMVCVLCSNNHFFRFQWNNIKFNKNNILPERKLSIELLENAVMSKEVSDIVKMNFKDRIEFLKRLK